MAINKERKAGIARRGIRITRRRKKEKQLTGSLRMGLLRRGGYYRGMIAGGGRGERKWRKT